MTRDQFRTICRNRELCWGTVMLEYMTPQAVRTIARAGYDWIWIDNEHAAHSLDRVLECVRAARDLGVISILRVAQLQYDRIAQALDIAPDGIIVPRIETVEQARMAVDCAKYPPVGKRGFGMRSTLFAPGVTSMAARIKDQNERILILQIETPTGVNNAEAIAAAAGQNIDALFFGPADYQVTIGAPDQPNHPELDAATRKISDLARKHHLSNGVPVTSINGAKLWCAVGGLGA